MPQGSLSRGGFSPAEIAKAWRDEHPTMFDDIEDADLIHALRAEDPDTYALIDPLLEGAEILPTPAGGPPPAAPKFNPPNPTPTTFDTLATAGLRMVPPLVAGGVTALATKNPVAVAAASAAGAGVGATAAQWYEKTFGARDAYSPGSIAFDTALGALNPVARGSTMLARTASQMGYGGLLGGVGGAGNQLIETGELPSWQQSALNVGSGVVLGGALHAGFEGVSAVGRRAPSFGDSTGGLPTAAGPPPNPLDQLVMAQAAAQQYQAEEARLAQSLTTLYGPDARPSISSDLHTAAQAKDYLRQLAAVNQSRASIDQLQESLSSTLATSFEPPPGSPYPPPAPRPLQLEAGQFGDPNLIELTGPTPPPANPVDRLGGQLEGALSQPPGPPRLGERPLLTREGVPRDTAEPPALVERPTPSTSGPIEQGARMGGRPATAEQPRIPGVEMPGADRPYTAGPNAGPRRKGELHGQPRMVRRRVQTGKKFSFEQVGSNLPAEDPGTYPPEVRRELASMAWELDQFRHERVPGGVTRKQIEDVMARDQVDAATAVATLRKGGATAGGAIAGAPVYHEILAAAEGSFAHATRANTLQHIREALLEGKGNGLTDAAAQVARSRLAQRAAGGRTPEGARAGSFTLQTGQGGKGGGTKSVSVGHDIRAAHGDEGDTLIGWVDRHGEHALPEQDLDEFTRGVRGMDDGEVLHTVRMWQQHGPEGLNPDTHPFFEAAVDEAVHRGLITPEQQALVMEGPGGEKGPSLFDFEGGPPAAPGDQVTLYRGQAKAGTGKGLPEWVRTDPHFQSIQQDAAGRWYTDNPEDAQWYADNAGDGEVVTLQVPREVAERYRAGNDPTAQSFSRREGEYFLPRDVIAGGPPPAPTDTTLPGMEGVRSESRALPEVADVPFALTPPPAKPAFGARTPPSLFDRLKGEEGVVVLRPPPPAGDRVGLKKWLKDQEPEHGGETWFSRVEQHVADGNWDKAWKAAAAASVHSYARAYKEAKSPQAQRMLDQSIRGTALQNDLNTQIISGARTRAEVGTAPPVSDFPPSQRVSQAGAARGRATIGPAGVLNPGPRQRPLSTAAPALRAATLDREVVRLITEGIDEVEGLSTVPGNTDTYLRLFRQIGDQIYQGQNLKLLRDAGVRIPPEELAQHWNATISDAGRTLQLMSSFAQAHREVLTEAAEAMSMGGAVRGMLGGGPPVYTGDRGRVSTPAGQRATQEVIDQIAERTSHYQAVAMANDLQKRSSVGPLRALHDASYSWMLSKWNTAVRNYVSFAGRYGVDSLDHALTIPIAQLAGDTDTATLSKALLQERGLQPMGRRGTSVTPQRAWSDDLQGIYDFTADSVGSLPANDARQTLKLLLDQPEQVAQFLGTMSGEDLQATFSSTPVLRHLVNPRVQRVLTMFNRAQEFSARATVFDATTRALVRAKGLDPNVVLTQPTPAIIQAVGGQQALDDLLFTATSQSLEATFAGRTSKDSLPGALIRFINEAWPLKLGVPFPRFNFSAAPRWIFDHSPAALLDLARFPLDRVGITAPQGTAAGGRLYRGVRAQEIVRDELPALQLRIGQAEKAQGTALQELLGTQREYAIRQRQVARLEKRANQGRLPATDDPFLDATNALEQLARRRETLKSQVTEHKGIVTDLKSEQKKLLNRVTDATAINAPNYAQFLARMGTGTVGMLGAAWVVRAQEGAQGTRWYEFRVDREGKDPIVLDFRPFAPFAQYLFVADVLHDFSQHTDWQAVRQQVMTPEEGVVASPLDWAQGIWNNYEGKYTEEELGTQFAQAFLSISRAAGTTLTLTDLLTQNGWPSLGDASRAIVGTIGQFLSRFTVPGQQIGDIAAHFDPEEAKVRTPPKATVEDWERPLAAPIANIPGARQLIPESISQTTGKPVATEYPLLRALAGIGTTPRDFVTEEVRRIGVPGASVFVRETGDVGLDRMVAESYAKILGDELPGILEDPAYTQLETPARQRDYMQRYIFPALKRAALADAREALGDVRFEGATVTGENARRQQRQTKLLDALEGSEPAIEDQGDGPPPGPPDAGVSGPPPVAPF